MDSTPMGHRCRTARLCEGDGGAIQGTGVMLSLASNNLDAGCLEGKPIQALVVLAHPPVLETTAMTETGRAHAVADGPACGASR